MKKSLKLLSMILAILMMAATLPMAVFATEGAEASNGIDLSGYADGYTIMTAPGAMAPLADNVHSNLPEGALTATGLNVGTGLDWEKDLDNSLANNSYDAEDAEMGRWIYRGVYNSGSVTNQSGIKTNLPLNADSKYTLTFDATYSAGVGGKFVMWWMSEGTKGIYGVGLKHSDNVSKDFLNVLSETGAVTETELTTPVVPFTGEWKPATMLVQVEINGTAQTVYVNGVKIHEQTVDYSKCDGYLYLGSYVSHARSVYSQNKTIGEFKYVSVQKGCVATDTTKAPKLITVDDFVKGDVLMTADAAFGPALNSVKSPLTTSGSAAVMNVGGLAWMMDNGTAANNSYDAEEAVNNGQWLYRGVYSGGVANQSAIKTDLPLNADSQYTLTFDATYSAGVSGGLVMWWMSEGTKGIYGVGMKHSDNVAKDFLKVMSETGAITETELTTSILPFTGEWKPATMLVQVEIDGTVQTVYINGVKVHEQIVDYSKCDGYLYLGSYVNHSSAKWAGNKVIADFNGVTVQKGLVANEVIATYTDVAGNDLGWNWNTKNETVAFPAVDVAADHTLVWKTADGVVVDDNYVITEDTTFVAYQMHNAEVKYFGVQQSLATEDGKCQLRVLATLKGLDAQNAGFDVEAKYMNGETLVERTDLGKYVTVVYDKINATENNTVRTVDAEENGGNYIMGLVINGVPVEDGQIDFYIKAFVTIDGVKVYSDTDYRTVSLVDGKLTADATLLGVAQ